MPKELIVIILIIIAFFSGMFVKEIYYKCPDLPNPDIRLQTQVDVLTGQVTAITNLYNDYGYRIQIIEDKLRIFERD